MNNKRIISILMSLALIIPQTAVLADDVSPAEPEQNITENYKKTSVKTESFDSNLRKWTVNSGSGFYLFNKQLVLNNTKSGSNETYILSRELQTENCELEFDMNVKKGEYFASAFRMQDDKTLYCLRFYCNSGKVLLLKKVKGGSYVKVAEERCELAYNTDYRVGITLTSKEIKVRLNGNDILKSNDNSIKSGGIGFFGKNVEATVDNIEIFRYDNVEYEIVEQVDNSSVKEAKTVYVSPDGSDEAGEGTQEKPYKTITAAKEAAIKLKKGNTPVNVIFEGGEYPVTETINFTQADSGKATAPIKYMAKEGEKVVFTGAVQLDTSKFEPINAKMKERLYDRVKDKVLQMDLNDQGIPDDLIDFTKPARDGQTGANLKPPVILLNDSQQTIARWPNTGYNMIHSSEPGDKMSNGKKENAGAIYYTESTPARWLNAENLFIEGYLGMYWHGEWAEVDNIDTSNNAINMKYYTQYGISPNHRWSAINLIEELDAPGEWYIDRETKILYYYPPHELTADDKMEVAVLKTNMLSIFGTENVTFEGIEFTMVADDPSQKEFNKTGGNGIYIGDQAKNVTIKDCTLSNIGMNGIYIETTDITIDGCVIYNTGMNGVYCTNCGDRNTLKPSNVVIQNCDISDVCRDTNRNSWGGIILDANTVDVTIKNNVLHNIKNSAIRYSGNGHRIAYNEIYNDAMETSDAGAIYSGRSWAEYGTVIEYNFFHNIGMMKNDGPYLSSGTFWDDYESGQEFSHNIAYINNKDKSSAIQVGGGVDNVVVGNTMVAAQAPISGNDRSTNRSIDWPTYAASTLKMSTIPYTSTEFMAKYPKISTLLKRIEENGGELKLENTFTDNLTVDCAADNMSKTMAADSVMERNVVLEDEYSIFVNPDKLDYRVKKEAKEKFGISDEILDEDFDLEKIGIQSDYKPDSTKMETTTLYPQDNAENLDRNSIEIGWSKASMADNYRYVVATDPEFKNIIIDDVTYARSVKLEGLTNNTKYYWTVYACNNSRKYNCQVEAVNKGKSFTIAEFDILDKSVLNDRIEKAKALIDTIAEGDKVGEYKKGTKDNLKARIAEAEAVAAIEKGTQAEIDNEAYLLNNYINSIESYINCGYTTLNINTTSEWYSNNANSTIMPMEGSVRVESVGGTELSLSETLSNFNVMCFRTKIDKLQGTWVAYGLRALDRDTVIYGQDSYYILVKPDIFELQKHGVIYATAPNNGKMREGEWYDIQFGAITTQNGINMMFKLNDEVIFDYLDKTDPQYKPGMFAMFSSNNGVEIAEAKNVPDELYIMSDKIQKEINEKAETGMTLNIEDSSYAETGEWNTSATLKGENGDTVRSSSATGASVKWQMVSGALGNAKLYRVYYYHIPDPNGDKNVKVHINGSTGDYETTIDLSSGTEGYVELGTFIFMDPDYIGRLSISFEGSGTGNVNVSSIKYELADESKDKNMLAN